MIKDRVKLNFNFDPVKLKNDLIKLEKFVWTDHFVKENFEGTWSVIPLRACSSAKHPIQMISYAPDCDTYTDTEYLGICEYIPVVLSKFNCNLQNVRLMKLDAGSKINEHRDYDLDYESGKVRIHIPVKTNNKVKFYLNNKRVKMQEGECWYLRLSDPHSVINSGKEDRIHLVIDAVVNDWVKSLINDSIENT